MVRISRSIIAPLLGIAAFIASIAVVSMVRTVAAAFNPVVITRSTSADPTWKSILPPMDAGRLELSCYDAHILPVWHDLKNDSEFKQHLRIYSGITSCSEMVEIRKVDLNRDGKDEFLIRGKGTFGCGPTGNCLYWIFERKNGSFFLLLATSHVADQHEFGVDEIQKPRAFGYPDILLTSYDGQNVLHFRTYRFNGSEYVESRCMSEVPRMLSEGPGSWDLITCDEFYRRRDEIRRAVDQRTE